MTIEEKFKKLLIKDWTDFLKFASFSYFYLESVTLIKDQRIRSQAQDIFMTGFSKNKLTIGHKVWSFSHLYREIGITKHYQDWPYVYLIPFGSKLSKYPRIIHFLSASNYNNPSICTPWSTFKERNKFKDHPQFVL